MNPRTSMLAQLHRAQSTAIRAFSLVMNETLGANACLIRPGRQGRHFASSPGRRLPRCTLPSPLLESLPLTTMTSTSRWSLCEPGRSIPRVVRILRRMQNRIFALGYAVTTVLWLNLEHSATDYTMTHYHVLRCVPAYAWPSWAFYPPLVCAFFAIMQKQYYATTLCCL
jgi:hypothetical protein